jgi:4-amino-4-deoxy-L-arabinose transferase-like glycosyltransferase
MSAYDRIARAAPLALLAALLAATFVLRYPSLFEPRWYGDEGIFAAVAENVRHGHMLYSGAWDNKPPLIFLTYAGVQSLFGTGVLPIHLAATVAVLATEAVVAATAWTIYGRWRAVLAALVFALVLGTPVIEGDLAMTETFMILPTSLAVLVFARSEARGGASERAMFAAGALIGVAAAYKQVAIFDGIAIGVMLAFLERRPARGLVALAGGFVAPQALLALVFLGTGAFGAYWYAVVGSLGLYARLGPREDAFVRFAAYLPALLVIAVLLRRRDRGDAVTLEAFAPLWLAFALAGVTSSTFAFPHYLQQGAPALALTAAALPVAGERDGSSRLALVVSGVLVAAVAYAQFSPAYYDRDQMRPVRYYQTFIAHQWGDMSDLEYDYRFDGSVVANRDISDAIREDGAGNTAFTWSELPWLYAQARLTNPSRYYTSFLGAVIPGARDEILRDLEARPPVYVVMSDSAYAPFEELQAWVDARYALIRAQGDWRLYRLGSATGRLPVESPPSAHRQ